MSKIKVLVATNIESVDRAVGDVVEVGENLAEVLISSGVAEAQAEESASAEASTGSDQAAAPAAPEAGAGEGEAASA